MLCSDKRGFHEDWEFNLTGRKEITATDLIRWSDPGVSAGSGVFVIYTSSSSDLPISFTFPDSEISFSENRVTPLSAGRVAIVAHQDRYETYSVASHVQRVSCITPVKPLSPLIQRNRSTLSLFGLRMGTDQWSNGKSICACVSESIPWGNGRRLQSSPPDGL